MKRIDSLDSLRSIAFILVFMSHTGISAFSNIGHLACSLFLILSGFVLMYSQYEKLYFEPSLRNNYIYAKSKIKKIYPLYFVTLLLMLPFCFIGEARDTVLIAIIKLVSNIFCVQEYFPLLDRSLNLPTWYLCTLILSYFIFPWVLKKVKKSYSLQKAKLNIIILYLLQILICFIGYYLQLLFKNNNPIIDSDIFRWFVYYFPLSRIIDIFIGYNLGYIFINKKNNNNQTKSELLAVVLLLLSICFISITKNKKEVFWFVYYIRYSVIFTPFTGLLVYSFAHNNGKISSLLTNRFTLYLANITSFAFLIHIVVFTYMNGIITILLRTIGINIDYTYICIMKLTIGFILTIIISILWNYLIKKRYNEKNMNNNNDYIEISDLKETQLVLKFILFQFHKICVDNSIKYSVFGGTFLGAIRHKGFIPWDDDVDVCVSKEDYNRLIDVFNNNELFVLKTIKDKNYGYPYYKLCLKNTNIYFENCLSKYNDLGIYIDIFPIYNYPVNDYFLFRFLFINNILRSLSMTKIRKPTSIRSLILYPLYLLLLLPLRAIGPKAFVKIEVNLLNKEKTSNNSLLFGAGWRQKGKIEFNLLKEYILYDFEDIKVMGFKNYEKLLTNLYGDYMQLPSEDKRISEHNYKLFIDKSLLSVIQDISYN